jgi:hypothetical protein
VRRELLTLAGLRTLEPIDLRYAGRYFGPIADRDRAAHNGSVYPWLLGPFVTALVRAVGQTGTLADARAEARAVLAPCLAHLKGDGLGHLYELADGDAPPRLRRCGGLPAVGRRSAAVLRRGRAGPHTPPAYPSALIAPAAPSAAVAGGSFSRLRHGHLAPR